MVFALLLLQSFSTKRSCDRNVCGKVAHFCMESFMTLRILNKWKRLQYSVGKEVQPTVAVLVTTYLMNLFLKDHRTFTCILENMHPHALIEQVKITDVSSSSCNIQGKGINNHRNMHLLISDHAYICLYKRLSYLVPRTENKGEGELFVHKCVKRWYAWRLDYDAANLDKLFLKIVFSIPVHIFFVWLEVRFKEFNHLLW